MLSVRDLDPADVDAAIDVRARSFGPLGPDGEAWLRPLIAQCLEQRRLLAAYDGGELVGTARARGYTQVWGGRPVPMAGIEGVVVAPHARGRGVATALMLALLQRANDLGDVVSVLYPATVVPYRRLGYELAGVRQRVTIDSVQVRDLRGGPPVRRALPSDAEAVAALIAARYERDRAVGPKLPDLADLRSDLAVAGTFSYVADGGFVSYGWDDGDLVVQTLVAGDPDVARALWAVVGSGSSSARTVHAWLAPHDPVHQLVADNVSRVTSIERWMLRLLDAPAAVAARGFTPSVTGSAAITVTDPQVATGDGSFALEVAGGRGVLTPSTAMPGALQLGPRGLACLYAGTAVRGLRAAGLASGGTPAGDELLDAALAGLPAYLLEHF